MINEKEYKLLKEAKIEEYEKYKKASDYFKVNIKNVNQSMLDDLPTESKEAEVKSKQELMEKWESAIEAAEYYGKGKEDKLIEYMRDFVGDLKQLEEPETLSEYWIEQKLIDTHVDTLSGEVQVTVRLNDLENLLVPKQELPVIPKFVADWIVESKHNAKRSLRGAFMSTPHEINDWLHEDSRESNFDTFAKAWLTYPDVEIEEEQRYYVLLLRRDKKGDSFNYLAKDNYHDRLWVEDSRTDGLTWDERSSFTEKEIRKLDKGDVLFRHFAVKVEELEE